MWIFNTTTLICAGIGFLGGLATYQVTGSRESVIYGALTTAILVDVWYRFRTEETENPFIDPNAGGHLWFVPIWGVGIVVMILFALSHFRVI